MQLKTKKIESFSIRDDNQIATIPGLGFEDFSFTMAAHPCKANMFYAMISHIAPEVINNECEKSDRN